MSNGTTPGASDAAAALKGASLAFQNNTKTEKKKPPRPPPPAKKNGALLAATTASTSKESREAGQSIQERRSPSRTRADPAARQNTGGTINSTTTRERGANGNGGAGEYSRAVEYRAVERRLTVLAGGAAHLSPPVRERERDPKSPSFIAATLAASRSASPTPRGRSPRRAGDAEVSSFAGAGPLISMFETGGNGQLRRPTASRESSSARSVASEVRSVVKPKPRPPLSTIPSSQRSTSTSDHALQAARQVGPKATRPTTSSHARSSNAMSPDRVISVNQKRPPTPPKPRGTATRPALFRNPAPWDGTHSDTEMEQERRPIRRRGTAGTISSDDTFVSASSIPSRSPSPPPRRRSLYSAPSSPTRRFVLTPSTPTSSRPAPPPRRNHAPSTPTHSLPVTSLSNAIVASSLASSRLTPHNTGNSVLSPPRPRSPRLRPTLRKQRSSSSEDERSKDRKKRNHKFGGKKHAHQEGSRKRWRDRITDRERKRYEAVWASNRGYLTGGDNDHVVNVVVREIWRRSRLPLDELADVWDLVDREGRGRLDRRAFVVGMWLVDQRLRGRKIPAKVGDSVWDSAQAVSVRGPSKRK